ncbi:MAG: hypothetical protein JXA52_02815 [Planctomycetes bacterium]|nr:hypothetical protein [Planctomycetota bacterium]
MSAEITKITLNDEFVEPREVSEILSAVSDQKIILEKGGYVFKASIVDTHLYLGLRPCFLGDRKIYHYDLTLPVDSLFTLSGNFNSNGTITMLFELAKRHVDKLSRKELESKICACALELARFFIGNGIPGGMALDTASQLFLEHSNLFDSIPQTLAELAEAKIEIIEE